MYGLIEIRLHSYLRPLDRSELRAMMKSAREEFALRTMWSLSNAFTSAIKELEAIPQFRATAKLGERLRVVKSQEEQARRRAAYDVAAAERDKLAAELAEV